LVVCYGHALAVLSPYLDGLTMKAGCRRLMGKKLFWAQDTRFSIPVKTRIAG
jgi:hypothetical protein